MKRYNKIILITASIATALGMAISAAAIALGAATEDAGLEYKTKTISEQISSVDISVDYDDVVIVPRDTDKITVSWAEDKTKKYNITAENNTLSIKYDPDKDKKLKWYEHINFNFLDIDSREHELVIEVPKGFSSDMKIENGYGDLTITDIKGSLSALLNCGDIEISGCDFTMLECEADYGDIEIRNTVAENIKTDNDCGDTEFVDVAGNIAAHCDYGDIEFERISGDCISLENNCGDIEGTIFGNEADYTLSGSKRLEAHTDFGDVEIRYVK